LTLVTIGSASHIGRQKEENQDFFAYHAPEDGIVPKEGILLALADGMGGRPGGATASRIAIDAVMEDYFKNIKSNSILKSLHKTFLNANEEVMAKGDEDRSLQGMGTTLVVVVIKQNKMYYANVGDSRGYIIHDDSILQFTKDDSVVADLVRAGYITEEQAPTYPGGNLITKAIGIDAELKVKTDKNVNKLKDQQYILLCCDGLYKEVPDDEIVKTINEYQEPDIICEKLIEKANKQGGEDNITLLIAKVTRTNRLSDLAGKVINLVR